MRTRLGTHLGLAVTVALLASLATVAAVFAAETTLTADLHGVAEGDNPGDLDGNGTATITVDPETGQVCWDMTAQATMPITQSHIHTGAAGASGGVLVPLDVDGFEGSTEGCAEDQDPAALEDIVANPAGFYVNLHTEDFPAGAIRGQLAAATQPNTAVTAAAGVNPMVLLGLLLLVVVGATAMGAAVRQRG